MSSRRAPDHRDIDKDTTKNNFYRKVIYTIPGKFQLVLMSIKNGEDIPFEIHPHTAQFIRVESGKGYAIVGKKRYLLKEDISITIPPNKRHYIKTTSKKPLKLYVIYTPPEHKDGLKQMNQPCKT